MKVLLLKSYRICKRTLTDTLHRYGEHGNMTTRRDIMADRLLHYLQSHLSTLAPEKGFVVPLNRASEELVKALDKVGVLQHLSETESVAHSWLTHNGVFGEKVVAREQLFNKELIIIPEKTTTGVLKSLIEKGV